MFKKLKKGTAMSKVYEFYDPFKNPKVSVQNEQNSILPPQKWNTSQNDALAQRVRNMPSSITPNYNLYRRGNFGQNGAVVDMATSKNNVFKATYPQNNFEFEPWEPFDQCQQPCHKPPLCDRPSPPFYDCRKPCPRPPKPRLCPRCGLPKNMCRCFPQKFDHCFPNFVCFPVSPFPPCAPFDNNLQFGINFSSISMPQYDNFQSQKSFMFWLGKNCYC